MSDWFKDNLLGLLPPLYEHNDEAGDLRTFLSLPAGTLDELKQAIDDFPTIFDVDHCDERFLPLLARLVGLEVDGTCSPDCQRRRVREAVEIYRRKGTIPAIERDFDSLGWQGNSRKPSARLCVSMPVPVSAAPSYPGWCSASACFACCVSTRRRGCATLWYFTTRRARAVSGSSSSWNGSKAARCSTSGMPTTCAGSCWRFSTKPLSSDVPRSVPVVT